MPTISRRNLTLTGLSLAACRPGPARAALREVSITLSSSSLGPGAPRVAKELGLFERHGLAPRIIPMDSGTTALAAVISGSAAAAMVGSATAITARARGQRIVSVVNGYGGFATTMVVARTVAQRLGVAPDAPAPERLKAVNGLLVGTPEPTAGSTVGFKAAAATVGAAMRFTYLAQQAMPAALEKGAIEGFLASAPYWAVPVLNNTGVVWLSGPEGELPAEAVNASSSQLQMLRDTADADPDLVRRFVAVFDDLHEAIRTRPDQVKAATLRAFPGLDPQLVEIAFPSESRAWNARPLTAADWAGEIAFARNTGAAIPGLDALTPADLMLR